MKIAYFNNLSEAMRCCHFLTKNGLTHHRGKITTINKWYVLMDDRAYMYWEDLRMLIYESK